MERWKQRIAEIFLALVVVGIISGTIMLSVSAAKAEFSGKIRELEQRTAKQKLEIEELRQLIGEQRKEYLGLTSPKVIQERIFKQIIGEE